MMFRESKLLKQMLHDLRYLFPGIALLLSVFLLGADLLGYQKFVVISGSMEPAIPVGACILVKEKEAEEIAPGEILTFGINSGKTVVTHRVVENHTEESYLITKGDANEQADGAQIAYSACIGTVRLMIPGLGFLLVFLNSINGKTAAVCILLLCVLLWSFAGHHERRKNDKRKKTALSAVCGNACDPVGNSVRDNHLLYDRSKGSTECTDDRQD